MIVRNKEPRTRGNASEVIDPINQTGIMKNRIEKPIAKKTRRTITKQNTSPCSEVTWTQYSDGKAVITVTGTIMDDITARARRENIKPRDMLMRAMRAGLGLEVAA